MQYFSKMFRLDNNVIKTDTKQRIAFIANNSSSEQKDQLCPNMISEIVALAAEGVKSNQRTTSITTKKIDEVGLLQTFLAR